MSSEWLTELRLLTTDVTADEALLTIQDAAEHCTDDDLVLPWIVGAFRAYHIRRTSQAHTLSLHQQPLATDRAHTIATRKRGCR